LCPEANFSVISFARRESVRAAAETAYRRIIDHARDPAFFTGFGVPDTIDGRFEMICLHAFLYLYRLKSDRPRSAALAQAFFDAMFADFDRGLRDLGTGDLSVGRQVKRMAQGFYGRVQAYEGGLAQDGAALAAALARNVFGTTGQSATASTALAGWVRCAATALATQRFEELCAGAIRFPPPSVVPSPVAAAEAMP
jgi:cytochrome b pre-mRNA-processing protein 3